MTKTRNRILAAAAFVAAVPCFGFFLVSFAGHPLVPGVAPTLLSGVAGVALVVVGVRLATRDS